MAQVGRIHCPILPWDWPFPRDAAARIEAHWANLRVQKPRLFDGRVLMARRLAIDPADGGTLSGEAFEVAYKSFLSWRDFGFPGETVHNLFAMPALQAADGPFMLGKMSATTANGGRLYFPAGTPEPTDAGLDGCVDFDANILRELEEETGLRADDVSLNDAWTIVFAGPLVACMKVARSPLPAAALAARVATFVSRQAHPELDGLMPVASEADFDAARMPPFMLTYLRAALEPH